MITKKQQVTHYIKHEIVKKKYWNKLWVKYGQTQRLG